MSSADHLHESAARLLELSDEERVERIRSPRWIGYPKAKQVLGKMEDLLTYPQSHRMPNLLIVGDTNNGKTMLVQRFCSSHPAEDNPEGEGVLAPVIFVEAPPVPDESRFYDDLLDVLFAPYKKHESVSAKEKLVLTQLKNVGVKMLVVDEIHHLLAGSLNRQRAFLNVIKGLGNKLRIPIVGVGTRDAFRAIQTDQQLSNRFEPALLPLWQDDTDFKRLLASFECLLPLRNPSKLHELKIASRLHLMSGGYIGELSRLLSTAAVHAVKTGSEKIDGKVLDAISWVSPADRKRQIDRGK